MRTIQWYLSLGFTLGFYFVVSVSYPHNHPALFILISLVHFDIVLYFMDRF